MLRLTKKIKKRVENLQKLSGTHCVWMSFEGYFTYRLFFETESEALAFMPKAKIIKGIWAEFIGHTELECEDELTPSYMMSGHTVEITYLD